MKFELHKEYDFHELPNYAKFELTESWNCDFHFGPVDCKYIFEYESYEKLTAEAFNILGPNFDDYIYNDHYVVDLADKIAKNGLQQIPIGTEEWHRKFASIANQTGIFVFKIIYPEFN